MAKKDIEEENNKLTSSKKTAKKPMKQTASKKANPELKKTRTATSRKNSSSSSLKNNNVSKSEEKLSIKNTGTMKGDKSILEKNKETLKGIKGDSRSKKQTLLNSDEKSMSAVDIEKQQEVMKNKTNDKKENKNAVKSKGTGLVLFIACMALVVGLFIGNTLMPAMDYASSKNNQTSQENLETDINIDMTPREVKVDEDYQTFDEIAPKVSCCVVGINCVGNTFSSIGSGVAVAKGGYILTNNHVIDEANTINILLADGSIALADVLWSDSGLDLAILKSNVDLPYLEISTAENVSVGEPVMAIGTPLSLQFQHSHTAGIISALNRMIAVQGNDGDIYMQNLIQHDASINPGNSGGPAITLDGKVIGINTLKISEAEGIGFAVPAWIIKPLLQHIIADGSYQTVYLGVYAYDSSIAEYNGYNVSANGVIVAKVDENGPLAQAGINIGDVITKVGDIDINNMLDLRVALYNYKVGQEIELTISRGGNEETICVILQKHPNAN